MTPTLNGEKMRRRLDGRWMWTDQTEDRQVEIDRITTDWSVEVRVYGRRHGECYTDGGFTTARAAAEFAERILKAWEVEG